MTVEETGRLSTRVQRWWNATTERRRILPAYVLLVAGFTGAFWVGARQSALSDVDIQVERCLEQATRSEGLRYNLFALYDNLDLLYDEIDATVDGFEEPLRRLRARSADGREQVDLRHPHLVAADCVSNDS